MLLREWRRDAYLITMDPARVDLDVVHGFLTRSYWAEGRSREAVERTIAASVPFSLYEADTQIGFARVITDHVVLAFLADVFVVETHRGRGLGTWLVETVTSLPELANVRRWLLGTRDAHELYRKFGFWEPPVGLLMERMKPNSDNP